MDKIYAYKAINSDILPDLKSFALSLKSAQPTSSRNKATWKFQRNSKNVRSLLNRVCESNLQEFLPQLAPHADEIEELIQNHIVTPPLAKTFARLMIRLFQPEHIQRIVSFGDPSIGDCALIRELFLFKILPQEMVARIILHEHSQKKINEVLELLRGTGETFRGLNLSTENLNLRQKFALERAFSEK